MITRFLLFVSGIFALLGATVQGVGHLIRNKIQKHLAHNEKFGKRTMNPNAMEEIREWNRIFVALAQKTRDENPNSEFFEIYDMPQENMPFLQTVHPVVPRQSVAIFFRFANGLHLSWVFQHYATYYLTTDILASFLVVGIIGPILNGMLPFTPMLLCKIEVMGVWYAWLAWLLLVLSGIYFLIVVSIHRYLYTYIAVIRHCCAIMSGPSPFFPYLAEKQSEPSDSPQGKQSALLRIQMFR